VVVPVIVLAVALYAVARAAGLVGTLSALVAAHTMLAVPYVALNVGVSLAPSTGGCRSRRRGSAPARGACSAP
jgi:putative spermidine/putrescine transport system permease protein